MDSIDLSIIDILQSDGRITMKELGQRVGLTSPATIERVKKLEEMGVISRYQALVDFGKAGLAVHAFLMLKGADQKMLDFPAFAAENKGILSCYRIAGNAGYIVEAALPNAGELEQLINDMLTFGGVETFWVLSSPVRHKKVTLPRQE